MTQMKRDASLLFLAMLLLSNLAMIGLTRAPVLAQSEASSEASSEAGLEAGIVGKRGRWRWYRQQQMRQMQQARMIEQQKDMQLRKGQRQRDNRLVNRAPKNFVHNYNWPRSQGQPAINPQSSQKQTP